MAISASEVSEQLTPHEARLQATEDRGFYIDPEQQQASIMKIKEDLTEVLAEFPVDSPEVTAFYDWADKMEMSGRAGIAASDRSIGRSDENTFKRAVGAKMEVERRIKRRIEEDGRYKGAISMCVKTYSGNLRWGYTRIEECPDEYAELRGAEFVKGLIARRLQEEGIDSKVPPMTWENHATGRVKPAVRPVTQGK